MLVNKTVKHRLLVQLQSFLLNLLKKDADAHDIVLFYDQVGRVFTVGVSQVFYVALEQEP